MLIGDSFTRFVRSECNVTQKRIAQRRIRFLQDIFTTLVDSQWRWTLIVFALSFVLSWLGFAVIWWLIAVTHGDLEEMHLPPKQRKNTINNQSVDGIPFLMYNSPPPPIISFLSRRYCSGKQLGAMRVQYSQFYVMFPVFD